jgi:hypothetical protein
MRRLSAKLVEVGTVDGYAQDGMVAHWCPACDRLHQFAVNAPQRNGARWAWDGEVLAPTFMPSMNIKTNPPGDPHHQPRAASSVCHYILTKGRITFCGDCTHALAGQVVDLPDLPVRHGSYLT